MNKNVKFGVIGVITAAILGYFYLNQEKEPVQPVEAVAEVQSVQEQTVQEETTVLNPIVIVEKRSFTAEESSALISALEKKAVEEPQGDSVDIESEGQSGLLQITDKQIEEETINADGEIKEVISESVQEAQEEKGHYHKDGTYHAEPHTEYVTEDIPAETPQE